MIIVTVELAPGGDTSKKRHLGTAKIANDGSGSLTAGNYVFTVSKWGRPMEMLKGGRVEGFPRKRLGPWDLLYRALETVVGVRNDVTRTRLVRGLVDCHECRCDGRPGHVCRSLSEAKRWLA